MHAKFHVFRCIKDGIMPVRQRRAAKPHAKFIQRIVGAALSVAGLALVIAGAVLVRISSPLWYILFIGLPVIIVGVFLFVFSFQREVVHYVMTEQLGDHEIIPSASAAHGSREVICPHCGASVPEDSVYCNKCGSKL